MGSSLSYSTRPPSLTKIHAILNKSSVICTTTVIEDMKNHLNCVTIPKTVTIVRLDGSHAYMHSLPRCITCSCEINQFDIITVVKGDELICYACLTEAKRSFLIDRWLLLCELLRENMDNIKDLKGVVFSSLQSLLPNEIFTLQPVSNAYKVYDVGITRTLKLEYEKHIRLIYNDLSHLHMKLPCETVEYDHSVRFLWNLNRMRSIEYVDMIFHPDRSECEITEFNGIIKSNTDFFSNLPDALSSVKERLNV
jgi:hypothetical protein